MVFSCRYFADGSMYGQYDFAKFQKDALGDGYVQGVGNELLCSNTGSDMNVSVGTGRGYLRGYSFDVADAPETVLIPTADATYDRIDRVVARLSVDTNKNIILTVVQGAAATTPQPPALTRNAGTWEISLAQVLVPAGSMYVPLGNVTDERNDDNLCGIANIIQYVVPRKRLPLATTTEVGVVKVGGGISVDGTGTIRAATQGLTGFFSINDSTTKPSIKLSSCPKLKLGSTTDESVTTYDHSETNYVTANVNMSLKLNMEAEKYVSLMGAQKTTVSIYTKCFIQTPTGDNISPTGTVNLVLNGTVIGTANWITHRYSTPYYSDATIVSSEVVISELITGDLRLTYTGTIRYQDNYQRDYPFVCEGSMTPQTFQYFVMDMDTGY